MTALGAKRAYPLYVDETADLWPFVSISAGVRGRQILIATTAYCIGLLLPGERKSVEPMAAKIEPARVSDRHQSMHHFVADAPMLPRAPRGSLGPESAITFYGRTEW